MKEYEPGKKFSYDLALAPEYCDGNTGELLPMPNGFPSTDEEAEMTLPRPSKLLEFYHEQRRAGVSIRDALMKAWLCANDELTSAP